ncbi:hypothetical protein BKP37_05905 [Anaerobacillus alkalilacustris]|uniref:Virion structural protein n=1 Tax=Anaerobacillus alkalilacustris TaxID=393763 RepID=A0A1S2LW54_9BACI|nr:hypothetical protein [Anaerobacillus alkalilacustris]OIJ16758.1 hypothetical protein BKP37_05905 [Anaerobacillus alkalilacustris]
MSTKLYQLAIQAQNVNIDNLPLTGFQYLRTAQLDAVTGWKFTYNINSNQILTITNGSANVSHSNSMAVLSTGATTTASAKIQTYRPIFYIPGISGVVRLNAIFSLGAIGSKQIIGMGDTNSGLFFGCEGAEFGIFIRKDGVDQFVSQASWNGTDIAIDPTQGNNYYICYQWLEFGVAVFGIENPINGTVTYVHTHSFVNNSETPFSSNPALPLMAEVANTTNDSEVILKTASAMAFLEGDPLTAIKALSLRHSITVTEVIPANVETPLVSIRGKSIFHSKANRIPILIDFLGGDAEGTKPVTLSLKRSATLTKNGNPVPEIDWIDVDENNSVVQTNLTATAISGGTEMYAAFLSKDGAFNQIVNELWLINPPSVVLTLSAKSSNSSTIEATIVWLEVQFA